MEIPQFEPQKTTYMHLLYLPLSADSKIPFFHAHATIRLILSPYVIMQWSELFPAPLSGSIHSNISHDGQYLQILFFRQMPVQCLTKNLSS
jgi:hypothetical protein